MGQDVSVEDSARSVRSRTTEELFSDLYDELRKIAAQRMAHERVGDTLQATALVNEAWLRLREDRCREWEDNRELIAAASEAMRRILVDPRAPDPPASPLQLVIVFIRPWAS
jgi:hypothetical protein